MAEAKPPAPAPAVAAAATSRARTLVTLNGSPVRGGSVDVLLRAVERGAAAAGGIAVPFACRDLRVLPCIACGPEPTTGYCVLHDDMDRVYGALRAAHAIVVGSPVYFDTVSGPLKLLIDRCNCVTPLVRLPEGGEAFRPRWARTRRAAFVVACGERNRWDLAERTVRGFLKWIGARWEESLAWAHADNEAGSAVADAPLVARAEALGRRLIESPPLAG